MEREEGMRAQANARYVGKGKGEEEGLVLGDVDGGVSGPGLDLDEALFEGVDVGMREFMATEKRVRERRRERERGREKISEDE